VGAQLALAGGEPLGREGVEAGIGRRSGRRLDGRDPDAALDVGEDVAQLALGALAAPAVGRRPSAVEPRLRYWRSP